MQPYEWWNVGIYAVGFFCLWISALYLKELWYWHKDGALAKVREISKKLSSSKPK